MVNPAFQSLRSALHFHYHAFVRHTSTAADPSNVITVKKPICHRLFSIQTPQNPLLDQAIDSATAPVTVIPFHVYSGLNNRLAVRYHPSRPSSKRFALLGADQEGPDAEEESFNADSFNCRSRSLQCNALLAIQSAQTTTDSLYEKEHEEKDNDHIVPFKTIRRNSVLEKLQPIDTFTDSEQEQVDQQWQFETTTESSINEPFMFMHSHEESSISPKSDIEHYSVDSSFEYSFNSHSNVDVVFDAVASEESILAAFANPVPKQSNEHHVEQSVEFGHPIFPGCAYHGHLVNGLPDGHGELCYANGDRYSGSFRDGQPSGSGIFIWNSGCQYQGQFLDGKRHGRGTLIGADGLFVYQGHWEHDSRHGQGTAYVNGRETYKGSWQNNLQHGEGVGYLADNTRYEGHWVNGSPHGAGKVFADHVSAPHEPLLVGEWRNGVLVQDQPKTVSVSIDKLSALQQQLAHTYAIVGELKSSHSTAAMAC